MLTLLLGYSFSVIFDDSIIKLFKNSCSFRILTYTGAGVGWLYQEHIRTKYDMSGAKKFTLEHEFRYRVLTQILLICKYFCVYTHLVSTLELGTLLLLLGFYSTIIVRSHILQFKIVERVFFSNYLKLIFLEICCIKAYFIKILDLPLNDKIFFISLFFLFRYGFLKIYFWLDFFIVIRPFIFLSFMFIVVFSIFLPNYIIYNFLVYNSPKNIALLIKVITKKFIFYFLLFFVFIKLIVSDIDVQNTLNENFFKEIFFKSILFFVEIS